jgi:hypothetical protein
LWHAALALALMLVSCATAVADTAIVVICDSMRFLRAMVYVRVRVAVACSVSAQLAVLYT